MKRMNLKAAVKYQTLDFKKGVMWYYIIVLLTMGFICGLSYVTDGVRTNSDGGFLLITIIFLFVAGLNSFKEVFYMLLQNGVSRKTTIISSIIAFSIVSAVMAIIDNVLAKVFEIFESDGFYMRNLYDIFYVERLEDVGIVIVKIETFFIHFSAYMAFLMVGYFITMLYYRMNKTLKLLVSIGVPVSFIVAGSMDTKNILGNKISKFLIWATGVEQQNPYHLVIVFLAIVVLCCGLSWLLIRKAAEK